MQFLKDFKQLKNDLELMKVMVYDIDIDKEQRKQIKKIQIID
ncbi:hypothetical protein [Peptacetobacter hiranonis]|nr:hypothetical protein [Peptacetobacter hiranonis]